MTIIDLQYRDVSSGIQNYSTLQRKLITEIIRIRNEKSHISGILLSKLVCSTTVFNIISDSAGFITSSFANNIPDIENGHVMMGRIFDMDIFISVDIPRDVIYLTMDTCLVRDRKIDFLLEENDECEETTIEIKVISDLL
jgi:hypothetical protein